MVRPSSIMVVPRVVDLLTIGHFLVAIIIKIILSLMTETSRHLAASEPIQRGSSL